MPLGRRAIRPRKIIAYHKKMLKPMQGAMVLAEANSGNGASNAADSNLEEIRDLLQLCKVLFKTLRLRRGPPLAAAGQIDPGTPQIDSTE